MRGDYGEIIRFLCRNGLCFLDTRFIRRYPQTNVKQGPDRAPKPLRTKNTTSDCPKPRGGLIAILESCIKRAATGSEVELLRKLAGFASTELAFHATVFPLNR